MPVKQDSGVKSDPAFLRPDASEKRTPGPKAAPMELAADIPMPEAFRAIADTCLRQFRRSEFLLADGDEEAVHQARVALRRLRTILTVFKGMLADDAFGRLAGGLKWLASALGHVRDLDILLDRCRDDQVRGSLITARDTAFRELAAVLASPRAKLVLLDLDDWIAGGAWRNLSATRKVRKQSLADFAVAALDRLYQKVGKRGRDLAVLDDVARHILRKDVKKLRYAVHFFAGLFTGKRRKRQCGQLLTALERLQDRLGVLNDAATIPVVLARTGLDAHRQALLLGAQQDIEHALAAAREAYDAMSGVKRFWH